MNILKFFCKISLQYILEIFHPSHSRYNTRMATLKLDLPFRQSCLGQKTISHLGPKTWNNLPAEIKLRRCVNTFKHDIKKLYFDELKNQNDDIFFLLLDKRTPTRLFFHFPLHVCFLLFFFHVCASTPICSLYPEGTIMKIRPTLICSMLSMTLFH